MKARIIKIINDIESPKILDIIYGFVNNLHKLTNDK